MIAISNAWGEKRFIPNSDSPELGTTFDTRGKTMKKVLLATTALTLSAGVAYAEISMSGSARMGLSYDGSTTELDNRFTVNIDGKMESDAGLTFGARMRLRTSDGAAGTSPNGARVYMKSGGVTVAVGNINGAIDSMPNLYHSEQGYTGGMSAGDVVTVDYDGYSSNGGELGAEVIYSSDSFGAHLSVTDPSLGSTEERTAAHVSYTVGGWTLAVGTQQATGDDLTVVTAAGSVGDYGIGFSAADNDGTTKMTLAGSATMGATGVGAFVSDEEGATEMAFGLGVTYDLGGGAELGAGAQRDHDGDNAAEVGISFSF
jgi:outer membrane protein OmpU